MIDEMSGGGADRICTARQRFTGLWHGNFLEAEHAWVLLQSSLQIYVGRSLPETPMNAHGNHVLESCRLRVPDTKGYGRA
jgi:hypothetical protein